MDECSLNEDDEIELKNYIESKGMVFLSTPFSRAAAFRLKKMDVQAYKIGSGECNNYPLIELIAEFGKPMIISTGMNNIQTIKKTELILKKAEVPYCFMHTTNLYPTPPELVRLGAMQEMMREFPNIQIGLSDHTTSNLACFSAVAMGANILERHFTDSMSRQGPDIVNSMDPEALEELISGSKLIQKMRGGTKEPAKEEQVTIDFAFATVVTTNAITAGEKLTKENIWVKRPGTGDIRAENFNEILGKIAKRNIKKDEHLTWEDFE
jgi:sialic acid synthase SpsE